MPHHTGKDSMLDPTSAGPILAAQLTPQAPSTKDPPRQGCSSMISQNLACSQQAIGAASSSSYFLFLLYHLNPSPDLIHPQTSEFVDDLLLLNRLRHQTPRHLAYIHLIYLSSMSFTPRQQRQLVRLHAGAFSRNRPVVIATTLVVAALATVKYQSSSMRSKEQAAPDLYVRVDRSGGGV
ncbi:uncharacterized protein VDAG_00474 [Verticillium dahliae VdLs.17]|uniref:Uncharacterized protein n=1 Tax=Verticillium dahliae (strain VdLs.17 / ATCC MYA-4575 / FGSC 10137) TaxID=498257 RepID=G2WQ32_VERDV|nr:uncharacterized protein VDAG_00474 [Verticillium dahliae VdLs.17]EGY13792.1 hypothetical protein VDAG_00474 [Verticillium dahliae VdLs.17]